MCECEFRPARYDDLAKHHDGAMRFTARAIAAEKDGECLGVGGVYYRNGVPIAFSAFSDRLGRRDRVKGVREGLKLLHGVSGPVYAEMDDFQTAATLLAHCGFKHVEGRIWVRDC